jgi:hypothetical protein
MSNRVLPERASRYAPSLCFAFAFAIAVLPASVNADACVTAGDQTQPVSCASAVRRSYLDVTSFGGLSPAISADGLPWISQATTEAEVSAPLSVNPTDVGVNLRASLGQIRDYNAQLTAMKIEAAKAFAPNVAPNAAPPPTPAAALDVWTSFDVQGIQGHVDQTTRAGVGADYKLTSTTSVGVAAESGETKGSTLIQDDHKLTAYLAFRAAPAITIDARTEWQAATPSLGAAASERRSISVAPRLGKAYAVGGGETLEPFVTYRQAFDIDATGSDAAAGLSTTQSAGAGLTYAKTDSYSLSMSTDVENLGAKEAANISSKLQFKLPLQ